MAHFYITLPSNSSVHYYQNNTVARYTTRLENSVSLSGDWEVSLVEIQYPHTWTNLEKNECEFMYMQVMHMTSGDPLSQYLHKVIRLTPGYYDSVSDLVRSINANIKLVADEALLEAFPQFRYNPITKRLDGDINIGASVEFSSGMCTMLGIEQHQNPVFNHNFEDHSNVIDDDDDGDYLSAWKTVYPLLWSSAHACDIDRGFSSMYIYCNLLEHIPVGDTKAPLLRIVRVTGKSGEDVHTIYEKPLYVPLQQKNFDSIEIDIRSDTGKPVPFEYGKAIVTLHFRRCKIPYLLQ